MVSSPAVTPDNTNPDPVPAAAYELLVLQVPPIVASLNEVSELTQTLAVPNIAAGFGLTVTET